MVAGANQLSQRRLRVRAGSSEEAAVALTREHFECNTLPGCGCRARSRGASWVVVLDLQGSPSKILGASLKHEAAPRSGTASQRRGNDGSVCDGLCLDDRPADGWGAPPAVDVPLYGSLRRCCHLMELVNKTVVSGLLNQRSTLPRPWLHDLRTFLLKHYGVTSKTVQVPRRRKPTEPSRGPRGLPDRQHAYQCRPDLLIYSLDNCLNSDSVIGHLPLTAEDWATKMRPGPRPWNSCKGGCWPILL